MENKIFVSEIFQDGEITHGAITDDGLVVKNLNILIGEDQTKKLVEIAKSKDFFSVFRFCQYACFLQSEISAGFSLKITDFKKNMDNALDKHLSLEAKGWDLDTRNKYCKIVQDIIDNPGQIAEMSIITPFG